MDAETRRALRIAKEARDWPTIQELSSDYGIPHRAIRHAVALGEIEAFRVNVLRVNPESFADWMVERQKSVRQKAKR